MNFISGALHSVRKAQKKNWKETRNHPALTRGGAASRPVLDADGSSKGPEVADAGLPEGVIRQGWLRKSGMINAALKDRFFRLKEDGKLCYYADEKKETKQCGFIDLKTSKIDILPDGDQNGNGCLYFSLRFKWKGMVERAMCLQAESRDSRDAWVRLTMACPGGAPEKSAALKRREEEEKRRILEAQRRREARERKIAELGSVEAYDKWAAEQEALRRKRAAEERARREKEAKERAERQKKMTLRELGGSAGSGTANNKDKAAMWSHKLYGKIQVVDHFPQVKVQVVNHFADLHVQEVQHFADKPGKWQKVDHFPDFKIQFVKHFPDITIKFVDHFPGSQHK